MSLEDPPAAEHATAEPSRSRTISFDLGKLPGAGTALGVGLLSAAVLVAALHARNDFNIMAQGGAGLDLTVYLVGVAAVVLLLGTAVTGLVLERITEPTLVSWPGAAGAAGAGALLAVLIDEDPLGLYVGAGLTLAISAVGLAVTKAGPFVVSGLASLALIYGQAFDDLLGFADFGESEGFISAGAAITAFVIAVSVAGWFLRETPALTAVLAGIGGLAAMVLLLQVLVFTGMISAAFTDYSTGAPEEYSSSDGFESGDEEFPCDMEMDEAAVEECYEAQLEDEEFGEFDGESDDEGWSVDSDYTGPGGEVKRDVWTILGFGALLAAFWTGFGLVTGHIAFRILVLADLAIMIPAATMALVVKQPTWWEVALIVLGGVALLASSGAVRRRSATAASGQ